MRIFVSNRKMPDWPIGQHFRVSEDLSTFIPCRLEKTDKNTYALLPDGKIERPFREIEGYVVEITK